MSLPSFFIAVRILIIGVLNAEKPKIVWPERSILSRLSDIKKSIVQKFELAPEAVGCLRLTVIDNTNVYIENHKGIAEYTQKCAAINGGAFVIIISGSGLHLERFGRDNAAISGDIRSIQYEILR